MNEQLRELVKNRLAAAVNCPAKEDIVEEITADLTAKYDDLLDSGMTPEEAFAKVQEGIGDLQEVVAFINEANRRSEEARKTSDNPFAGLEDLMRQMGKNLKNLEPSMREVASDLKSAAGHLGAAAKSLAQDSKATFKGSRETLHGSKEAFKDIAHSVRSGLRSTLKNLSETFEDGRYRYDYTVPAADLNGVEVITNSGDVTFGVSQDDNIYIVELSRNELTEDKLARIQTAGGILTVAQGQKYSAGSVLFSYGMLQSDFEIYLPQRGWNSISVTSSSGDIDLEKGLEVATLTLHTVSGDAKCPQLKCGVAEIHTTSGDVILTGDCCEARVTTVSGDCDFDGNADKLFVKSTSGDFSLNLCNMPCAMELNTVSGDTKLYLPDNDGFSLRYQRVSGDVRSDFNLKTSLSDKSGTAVYLEGGSRTYSMQTVSGDLRIYRR
ncbi:MAG: DUF4097 family beta strand repeat protein [Clostridia bacterium]|nr:DUF4097 family beta strand repeat protein [Clostridia bacterium]